MQTAVDIARSTRAMVAGVCRSRRAEARIQQMLWKVDYSDIVFISTVRLCHVFFGLRELLSQSQQKGKNSLYSITERRFPGLIPVLGSQPAKPAVGCHYFPPGLQLPPQPLRGLLPVLLLGEQGHNGCEQFA